MNPIKVMVILLLSGGFTLRAHSQQSNTNEVRVIGEFQQKVNGNLTLSYRKVGGGKMEFDSAKVVNGKFNFKKTTAEPIILTMSLDTQKIERGRGGSFNGNSFYLNPGEVRMTGSHQLAKTVVSGSGTLGNAEYQPMLAALNASINQQNKLNTAVPSQLPLAEREKIWKRNSDSINLIRDDQVYLKFVKEHPEHLLSVLALNQYASEPVWRPRKKVEPILIEQLLATLPAKYQAYPSLRSLKQELQVSKATGPGKPIIDFALKDTAGRTVKLSDFNGKYVFLDFWASWCVPCRKENPMVRKAYAAYKDKGFTVMSVSLDKPEARNAWLEAIKSDQIGEWTHVVDERAFDGSIANSYFIKSIPTNFLIGPDGKFVARNLYGEDLEKTLAKIFGQNR